ncbi:MULTISPECIES: 3D-(3,5/4)-trihydroxycyclohexane-1,2-dione acylhydrolase (decyclizing) [unclassified Gemella]|uniref:3D-(3,5/4)-trihydroxycyclohexane-1,2-dione acylhydrolase (decyclizing) n=1 Tax=unclassified Gemella TaxID=2624949 RepID=UPI001C54EB95|nr:MULTISPECIES: 3D-(3,5/4)-trihydroxycyclohexane-1,2-dione acylhydrolase (decyclizing) [unclassified Gemella]
MNTIKLTTAQALIRFLDNQYINIDGEEIKFVEGIFNIFGHGNVLGIGQALQDEQHSLKVYQGKNEQGMALAAIGFAKQRKRKQIFACTSSVGPGAANFVTAAGVAISNNIPVLLLPGETFATRQPDPVLQQFEREDDLTLTTNDTLRAVSKFWDRITRPEQIMSSLLRAFEILTNPATTGPVTICLSQDVEGESYDYPEEFFVKRIHYVDRRKPSIREVKHSIDVIKDAKLPVILVGGGAKYSEATEQLIAVSKKYNIPLVETHAGKSTILYNFENYLGGNGILGTSCANEVVQSADLIIGLGTRYTDFTTCSKTQFKNAKKFINVNLSRMQSYKFDGVSIVADIKEYLTELLANLENYTTEYSDNYFEEIKEKWNVERERLASISFNRENFTPEIEGHFDQNILNEYADDLNTNLPQSNVIVALNDLIDKDSIMVAAAGSIPGDVQKLWNSYSYNSYNLEYGYSCMGYEVNGALGAKIAEPNREVYALLGDGSFNMLHSELLTSLQYGYKVNVVLLDNSGFGCINNLQMGNGSDSYFCEFRDKNNQIMNVDYAKVAEGYGAEVYRVTNLVELKDAIEQSKKSEKSTLIDIKVLPKTMTRGYDSWWNIGVSSISNKQEVLDAYNDKENKLKEARKY